MLRSLIPSSSSKTRRRRRQQAFSQPPHSTTTISRSSTSTSPTLIPELLPLVVPFADTHTLFSLCLVDRHTSRLTLPLLYDVVQLHSPGMIFRFMQRPPSARKRRTRHVDLILDPMFMQHEQFRDATLHKYDPSSTSTPPYRSARIDGLESLHLTTRGQEKSTRTVRKGPFGVVEKEYWVQDLVKIWVNRLCPGQGPIHFRWRHQGYNNDVLTKYPSADQWSIDSDLETPYHPVRWPFEFLSDWTSVLSIDLPLTEHPISEGFRLSSLEVQTIECLSIAGRSLSGNTISRILSDVRSGGGTRHRSRDNEDGKGRTKVLEVREPVVDEDIREGLDQLISDEDHANPRVIIRPSRKETPGDWRLRVTRGEWLDR
ncbi:hypothetical protein IAR55_004849 [Kwoniella newhampshirensis]|uniref:Uncharacterized protein n=1 Tax=Kwoniella newhampshirensis TaxID=1651941 RepID=A0AAW0YWT2_9TREE